MSATGATNRTFSGWLRSWPMPGRWAALVVLSSFVSVALATAGLPAVLLLGPMISAIVFGVNELPLPVPGWLYVAAQGVIGTMVAGSITPAIVRSFTHDGLLFCLVMAATLLAAALIGWLISRTGLIPGATAVYGTSPGAASAMVLLGEAQGADARLVAFMQYSRVLLVALAAALVAHLWADAGGVHAAGAHWFATVRWGTLTMTGLLAVLGQQAARMLRLQAWAVLGPVLLLSVLHAMGLIVIELPRWLLAAAFALIGWRIGLGFRRDALFHAAHALPVITAGALSLMGICGLLAWCLARLAHVDALTAYLATSPGGLDSVAIIAASSPHVDLPFVLALQSVRLLLVMSFAPLLTRLVVRHSSHLQAAGAD
jgi:membrane AbrB-like protein